MPFVVVSSGSMGSDMFRAPQKTIWNPEPDGPSGPGTTKLAQKSAEALKPVQGSLTDPLDALVAFDRRTGRPGCGRTPPRPKRGGSSLEQTCQKRILDAFPAS